MGDHNIAEPKTYLKKIGDAANHTRCINLLRLECLHNIKKLVVDMRLVIYKDNTWSDVEGHTTHTVLR